MPRKAASPPRTPRNNQTTSLALSDLHIRLDVLEKEHQSILKQIKRKRTELNNFVEKMRSLATDIFHKATPNFQKMAELDQEIHALFDEILTKRKFGKQTKNNVEKVYRNLQFSGVISFKEKHTDEDTDDSELDELFENFRSQEDSEQDSNTHRRPNWQTQQPLDTPSTARTDESRKIRQTFLKLAEIFHPDKVQDQETLQNHTEIMKEINKAYQEGDLARLLEIERQHQLGETIDNNSEDDLTRKCKSLEQQNEILSNQYENLKRELRLAKNTPEGAMLADARKAAKQGVDYVDFMVQTMEQQINIVAQIRDFVQSFRDQKMTIKEFLKGPATLNSMNEEMMEDLLDQMMSELEDMIIFE
ncbi:molecular chaperone DnaJ [Aliinostoc sp. HNIBRCY26]|uniref:molecular chaperone DnaJ n=1 Tax=Aliinostoc sp. HNIBRCY26 TaxID=3418997 RepID=UPI003CFFBBAD